MRRIDMHGNVIEGPVFTTKCYECGMPLLDAAEFHPYAACAEYEASHDSDKAWGAAIERLPSAKAAMDRLDEKRRAG